MSEMCCTRLAEIQDAKMVQKIAIWAPNKLLNSNMSSTCPHNMANLNGPLTAEICWRVWGTPANFNGFCVLPSLPQRRRSPEASQTLHDV